MRRVALLICSILVLTPWASLVAADKDIDGSLDDWDATTLMATDSNEVSFFMDWNASHLSFAWNNTDWSNVSSGADLFIYLNTTENGAAMSKDWGFAHVLPFAADYAFILEDMNYFRLIQWNGTGWEEGEQGGINAYIANDGEKKSEISIPLTSLSSPDEFGVLSWSQNQGEGKVWTSFPPQNPAFQNAAETFTHYYQVNLSNATNPSDSPVYEDERTSVKVDNPLNLALVFHQHQPYYRNMLTGMYEMPWVRVHSMTEYVDSPGILAKYPDTKIVYNLVPSLMEQMIDYNQNETLDIHTDWARRTWPVDEDGMVTGYPEMTEYEMHNMQFQSFWNSGWIYNVSQDDEKNSWLYPASLAYKGFQDRTLHNLKPATIMNDELLPPQDLLDLQVLWLLFQISPNYVQGDYADLGDPEEDGRSPHFNQSIIDLFMQGSGFKPTDILMVLDYQHDQMGNVLPMYSDLADSGQVELTTTPYYHPIMPLLMKDGWTMEDGITVRKEAWPDDTAKQLTRGMDLFESQMGFRPVGMWPSEQSTSPAMIQPVVDVGVEWFVSDEENLGRSFLADGSHPDTEDASVLTSPWRVTGADGGEVSAFFRDRVISDRIAFQYGTMTPEAAVTDFLSYLDGIRDELVAAGEDPSEHIITVALDGENWMFMSEFQHHDNARPFMEEWYSRLSSHPTIQTMTPAEFLDDNNVTRDIDVINTGSWIDGTLSTWAGEEEESLAWIRLVEARKALVEFEAANPGHSGLESAWESLYISEGSDWYWWYGLDQDSGYDELWDTLFKVHLSNIYRAVDLDLPPYLLDLWTNPATPEVSANAIIEPMIDGIALAGEWDGAAIYDASSIDGGDLDISKFYLGYDSSNVHIRVDLANATPAEIDTWDDKNVDLSIYFMQSNAINFNEVETNFRTYYGNDILGFPAKYMVSFDFSELRDDGRAKWNLFEAKGKVGEKEKWNLIATSNLGACAAKDVYEFSIPWSEIGLAPRYTTRIKVLTSFYESTAYGDGQDQEMAPPAPAEIILPDLEEWITLLDIDDAIGDDDRDGAIQMPLATDFASDGSLWDIQHLKISQSSWNARFEVEVDDITNIWGMSNGFSHQILQIYVDQGNSSSGKTAMLEGANAVVADDWAWEVALSATGEPGAVKAVMAESGETISKGIEVSANSDTDTITLTVNKDVIGQDVATYRYIIVLGSQDGFGDGKWRGIDASAKTWRLGGGADPASDDGIEYDPNILDMMTPEGVDQNAMLADYSATTHKFAALTGIEIPELEQQIFGATVVGATASSVIIGFQTTQATTTAVSCGQNTAVGANTTSHTVTVNGLTTATNYSCIISVPGIDNISIEVQTSAVEDTTLPEILNVVVVVSEDGVASITWYTSEAATEAIVLTKGNEEIHIDGSQIATSKNHHLSSNTALSRGQWTVGVTAIDASGNSNTSHSEFSVEETTAVTPGGSEEKTESTKSGNIFADTKLQILFLVVVLLTTLAMLRGRRSDTI